MVHWWFFGCSLVVLWWFIGGVKIWLDGGWVLLRPSNTQPVIRMFVEATDIDRLEEIKDEFKGYFDKSVEKFID